MVRPAALSPDDLTAALHESAWWTGDTEGIVRTLELPSFRAAVDAVVTIAGIAEEMDHHPDIDLRWRTVRVRAVTHSAGGVTVLDLDLAGRIDGALPG